MEATELRKKTDRLEKMVKTLLDQFIDEVGECEIEISITRTKISNSMGGKLPSLVDVKINTTV